MTQSSLIEKIHFRKLFSIKSLQLNPSLKNLKGNLRCENYEDAFLGSKLPKCPCIVKFNEQPRYNSNPNIIHLPYLDDVVVFLFFFFFGFSFFGLHKFLKHFKLYMKIQIHNVVQNGCLQEYVPTKRMLLYSAIIESIRICANIGYVCFIPFLGVSRNMCHC